MSFYKILGKSFKVEKEGLCLLPIRMGDKFPIMRWRNDQMHHLRQPTPLNRAQQERYFKEVIRPLFDQDLPKQILFSYLKGTQLVGYGGLVHIDWEKGSAEISFLLDTRITGQEFAGHWVWYLQTIKSIAFLELGLQRIFTYAYDVRPELYPIFEKAGMCLDQHLLQADEKNGQALDVYIHHFFQEQPYELIPAAEGDLETTYRWLIDPSLQKFSKGATKKIAFEDHKSWFLSNLKSKSSSLYLLHQGQEAIGQIRLDEVSPRRFKISFLIDPAFQGRGLGKLLIKKCIQQMVLKQKGTFELEAWVHKENKASQQIFRHLCFEKVAVQGKFNCFLRTIQ